MLRRLLILIVAASMLTGCGASTGSGRPPRIDPVDTAFTRPCELPIAIPERRLSDSEVERLWGRDRKHLSDCGARHQALTKATATRDALIARRARSPE